MPKKTTEKPEQHPFASLKGFDQAMRKIVTISKEEIERREKEHKLPPAR